MGYLSDSTYLGGRGKAFNPATKRLFEYGLIGLAIGAAIVAGLQLRPIGIFPTQGILQIYLTDGVPVVDFSQPQLSSCHGNCSASSLNVKITAIEVHTSGINNMTGVWTAVCAKQLPMTVDLVKVMDIAKNLCGASIQPDTITNVRMTVDESSITAQITGVGFKNCTVPSGKLEIPLSPLAEIRAGKTTTITVDFQPHIVITGTGDCKLTPVLHATTTGPA